MRRVSPAFLAGQRRLRGAQRRAALPERRASSTIWQFFMDHPMPQAYLIDGAEPSRIFKSLSVNATPRP